MKEESLTGNVSAVLFDLDGTLTDTEKYYQITWPEALAHFGWKAEEWMPLELRSLGRPFAPLKLKEWFGDEFDYTLVRNYRKKLMEQMILKEGIPLKPGAGEVPEWLRKQGILTAVVTANDEERTKRYLSQIGLEDAFDRLICADMVEKGKPAPDIYVYACNQLQIAPERAFAVEDSPNGVTSAYEAGVNVIMIPDLTEPDEELKKKLYARMDSLFELKTLFSSDSVI